MDCEQPTGRRRFRALKRLFRKPLLVVQVEVKTPARETHDYDPYGYGADVIKVPERTFWRDATVEDLYPHQWFSHGHHK